MGKSDKAKLTRRERTQERRRLFWEYLGPKCCVCGESDSLFLDFHHFTGNKTDSISNLLNKSIESPRSIWPRILETELYDTTPLCVICHRKLHAGRIKLSKKKALAGMKSMRIKGVNKVFLGVGYDASE